MTVRWFEWAPSRGRRHARRRPAPSRLAALLVTASLWSAAPDAARHLTSDAVYDPQALRALAERGDKRAAFLLGSRFAAGRSGVRDDSEAVRWFRSAADAGLAEAQYNLGIMYANGRGVPRDASQAAAWFAKAAEQGLAEAQFNLGTLYGLGRGVPRDEAAAARWLERAAHTGLAEAQYNLAALYEHGRGVRLDGRRALAWYRRAADQGFEPARRRHAELSARLAAPSGAAAAPAADGSWLAGLDPGHYTLQLASYTSAADASRFAATLPRTAGHGVYVSSKGGTRYYSVIYGSWATYDAARTAVGTLPARLRALRPWVRSVARIREDMQ